MCLIKCTLYQQYGPDQEYFRVTGMQDMQKYDKGKPGERFDFYMQFDAATQDPEQMLERVKAIAQLGAQLDKNGTLTLSDYYRLQLVRFYRGLRKVSCFPKETASQKAMDEGKTNHCRNLCWCTTQC